MRASSAHSRSMTARSVPPTPSPTINISISSMRCDCTRFQPLDATARRLAAARRRPPRANPPGRRGAEPPTPSPTKSRCRSGRCLRHSSVFYRPSGSRNGCDDRAAQASCRDLIRRTMSNAARKGAVSRQLVEPSSASCLRRAASRAAASARGERIALNRQGPAFGVKDIALDHQGVRLAWPQQGAKDFAKHVLRCVGAREQVCPAR